MNDEHMAWSILRVVAGVMLTIILAVTSWSANKLLGVEQLSTKTADYLDRVDKYVDRMEARHEKRLDRLESRQRVLDSSPGNPEFFKDVSESAPPKGKP